MHRNIIAHNLCTEKSNVYIRVRAPRKKKREFSRLKSDAAQIFINFTRARSYSPQNSFTILSHAHTRTPPNNLHIGDAVNIVCICVCGIFYAFLSSPNFPLLASTLSTFFRNRRRQVEFRRNRHSSSSSYGSVLDRQPRDVP